MLQEVPEYGSWEAWIEFFLQGVAFAAQQAVATVESITQLFQKDEVAINTLGKARFSVLKVFEYLKTVPQASVAMLAKEMDMSAPTVRSALII